MTIFSLYKLIKKLTDLQIRTLNLYALKKSHATSRHFTPLHATSHHTPTLFFVVLQTICLPPEQVSIANVNMSDLSEYILFRQLLSVQLWIPYPLVVRD